MSPAATVAILAIGLSMDAVAVSLSAGLVRPQDRRRRILRMPLVFGAFQAVMPALGWLGGAVIRGWIPDWGARAAAATVLAAVGGHMLWEARRSDARDDGSDPFAWRPLLLLGVATSLDALAAGTSIALIHLPPVLTAGIIGLVTTALCVPAVLAGRRLGRRWATWAEVAGGLALLALAAKIALVSG